MEMTMNLPRNYVEIEEEEMMYLEGGVRTYNNWWGTSTKLSKSECKKVVNYSSAIGIGAALALIGASGIYGLAVAVGLAAFDIGARNRGLWLNKAYAYGMFTNPIWVSF